MGGPGQIPETLIFLITITPAPEKVKLTAVQARIIRLVVLGCDDQQMAAIIGRSVGAIRRHKTRALEKIAAPDLTALTRWAIDHRLTRPGDRLSPTERLALLETEDRLPPATSS